ncbi:MAG: DUF7133 domain-containing protein [Sphingobacteriaceae bacterium]
MIIRVTREITYGLLIVLSTCIFIDCRSVKTTTSDKTDSLSTQEIIETSPLVPPEKSISLMTLEEGFEAKLVASEPFVSAPVALNFDDKNRIWAVEMQGYMPNPDGVGEELPSGKIVILEDQNKDGVVDQRKIFLDSLVLPRALCLIENGILIAEPPRLLFVEIVNDKPGKKVIVDEGYTVGGNVEAQSNSLFRAKDNWIYSAGSEKRYRKKGNKWLIERTHLRGQWGISQDDFGRLYYNNNSQNLLGDYFSPGLGALNQNLQRVKGFNERIISDNKVYPIRPTPGVNRGYKEEVLDESLRLKSFTAACGPVIYRGDLFGSEYYNNAFVAEPAGNLVKRNILEQVGNTVKGKQAYENKEFLASVDERFRPVSLYNGPDGALYVVDMYRGIIQHKLFLTDYLKEQIGKRELSNPINCGRIYKIVPKTKAGKLISIPSNPSQLVKLLQHSNGWIGDRAQQKIIDRQLLQTVPHLRELLKSENSVIVSNSMWTLEGLGSLQTADVLQLLRHDDWKVKAQTLSVLSSVVNQQNFTEYVPVLRQMVQQSDSLTAPYIAFQLQLFSSFDKEFADELIGNLVTKYADDPYVSEAIISTLENKESEFAQRLVTLSKDNAYISSRVKKVVSDINNNLKNRDINLLKKQYPRGVSLYSSTCQPCHGSNGNGVQSLAPPLNQSEWVTGDKDKLIAIVLFGLTGPVTVNHKVYKAPEISGDMPGIGSNGNIVDEDIAQLLSFIRNAWNNSAEKVSREEVIKIRKMLSGRETPFTVEGLNKL